MKEFLINIYSKANKIIQYFFYSAIATVADTVIVWLLYHFCHVGLTVANTVGVVTGFVISYVLSIKKVFDSKHGPGEFLIYFVTFVLGLLLANYLITTTHSVMLNFAGDFVAFATGKFVSIVVPFFAMYFARKYLYILLRRFYNE